MLVVQSHASSFGLLSQWIHSLHVSLQQIILVLDPILNEVLKFLHLNLHNDVVDIRVIIAASLGLF